MVVSFNTPVDNAVSSGVNAVYLNGKMPETSAQYISRAKYSIDVAQYNYSTSTTIAPVTAAINAAYTRGVIIRWIYDGSQTNAELANLNAGIHKLASPTGGVYGIMHDKFMVIDGNSTNHNYPLVWTGSPDWSGQQFNTCQNNAIIIQDYALAQAYIAQFNQMWGGTGIAPVTANEKFGPNKTSQGPHSFVIGGRTVELYFSPKDGTNSHILSSIASANTDLYFGVYTFTENTNATNIVTKKNAGIYVAGIVDQYSNGTTPAAYNTLTAGLGSKLITYANSQYVYHNKYMIVDPSNFCSDPQVLTGSHNWTSAADTKNDENMLIIHNDTIANIYYQAFHQNFTDLGGTLTTPANCSNPPVANFSASTTDCAGHAITLTDNSSNTPTSWSWTMTGGSPASSSTQSPSVTYSTAGTYTVTLVATNSSGSSSPVSHTITVNSNPAVPIITLSGSLLTSNSTTGNQWYLNGVAISGATNQTYTATSSGSYTVVVTNSFGCTSTSTATTYGTNNPPVANFSASTTDCAGHPITLTDNSSNTPTSWSWTMIGGSPASSSTQSPSVTYSTAGTYTVTLIATNSSGSSSPVSHTITVNTNPAVPTITVAGNILTSSSTTGNQWYLNSTLISGATNQTYTATASGLYTVVVSNSFGCTATSIATNFVSTGISSVADNNIFTVFPNPSNGIININFAGPGEHIIIEMINDLGQQVYIEKINDCPNDCKEIIDMSSFKKGIYLLRIIANENIQTKKLLLIK